MARHLGPYRGWIALAGGLGLCGAAAGSVDPLFYRFLLDLTVRAAGGHARAATALRTAAWAVAGLVVVNAAQQGLQAGLAFAANKVRFDASLSLSRQTLAWTLALPLALHVAAGEERGAGATMTRMDRGVTALGQLTGDLLQSLLPNLVNLGIVAALLFRLSPRLGWAALAPLPPFLWVSWRATTIGLATEQEIQEGWRRLYRRIYEVLAAIKTLKSLGGEADELARYDRGAGAIFTRLWQLMRLDTGLGSVRGLLAAGGRAAVLLYGADLVLAHRISPGTWIAAVSYAGMVYAPLTGLTGLYTSLATNLVTAGAAFEIAGESNGDSGAETIGAQRPRARGAIEFAGVSFAYESEEGVPVPVLVDIDLRIAPGEIVALAGPSGGGKTTLVDLLMGFYRPTGGAIRLDEWDLGWVETSWLREQIAVVLQDPVLFEGTVSENIAFGRPYADSDAIRSAARAAQADEFIVRLPEGYRTHIGERGARLSGGQRQRLAIARALLRDAPIVVLDEANSNLDAETEGLLNDALRTALAGHTVVLISHRPASLALADRVIVIAGGRLRSASPSAEPDPKEYYHTDLAAIP